MLINDIILAVLLTWAAPLMLFTVYFVTDPVPGTRWRRRLIDLRTLKPVSKILLTQKVALTLVVVFIGVVRFTGGFPGREWVAFGLYTLLVAIAWAAFIDLRLLQVPQERRIRSKGSSPDDIDNRT